MTKQSKSFGDQRALKAHLLQQTGGLSAEITDLRKDVEEGFQNNEARDGFPELDSLDPGTLLAAGQATFVLIGRHLLQSQTFDTLTVGVANAAVSVTCLKPGKSTFRLVIVQGTTLGVTFVSGLLTVTLATAGSTATDVVAAINAVTVGVLFAVAGGTGGSNVLVAASTALAGGVGLYAGNNVLVSGTEALPKHAAAQWTDTSITVTVPALTGLTPARAATDIVSVVVQSNGLMTGQLSAVLT